MTGTPLHPLFVHLPVALAVLMPLLAFALLAAWAKGFLPRRAWWVVVGLQAALVGGAVASIKSGEHDEERAEKVLSEKLIGDHEDAADAFTAGAVVVLLLALGGSLLPKEGTAKLAAVAASVGTLAVLGLGYRTGEKGGALVYEHNAGAAWSTVSAAAGPAAAGAATPSVAPGAASGGVPGDGGAGPGSEGAPAAGEKEHGSDRD